MSVMITLSRKRTLKKLSRLFLILGAFLFLTTPVLTSCASKKPRVVTTKKGRDKLKKDKKPRTKRVNNKTTETTDTATISTANTVEEKAINAARTYLGTKWKYAGNDKKGIDCSGLICTSYKAAGKTVPRTTWTLKEATKEIDIKKVKKGDLLFFATGSNKKRLNHVGLVVNVTPAEIQFIHASTSKGVIISSLNQPFWLGSYLSAGRL